MEDHSSAPPDDRNTDSGSDPDQLLATADQSDRTFCLEPLGQRVAEEEHTAQAIYHGREEPRQVTTTVVGCRPSSHTYREVNGLLRIAASSQAGRSQQAVDPVGHPTLEPQVSLDDPAFPIINKDFSLFRDNCSSAFSPSSPAPPGLYSRWRPSLRSGRTAMNPAESVPSPRGPDVQQKSKGQTTCSMGPPEECLKGNPAPTLILGLLSL